MQMSAVCLRFSHLDRAGPAWPDGVNPEGNISLTITYDTAPDPLAVGSTRNGNVFFQAK